MYEPKIGDFCKIVDINTNDLSSAIKTVLIGKKVTILDPGHKKENLAGFRFCEVVLEEPAGPFPKGRRVLFGAVKLRIIKKIS